MCRGCVAFGTGLTDVNVAATYAKLATFLFAAWAGAGDQGVIAGLVLCSVVFGSVWSGAELMQASHQSAAVGYWRGGVTKSQPVE